MNIGPELLDITSFTKIEVYPDGRTIIYTEEPEQTKAQLEGYEEGRSEDYDIVED